MNQLNRDSVNAAYVERNREHIKVVLDCVLFCAKQDLPMRGHRTDGGNKGNFLELLELLKKHDPQIQSRLDALNKNATMLSSDIQNELLESAANLLLQKIKTDVHTASDAAELEAEGNNNLNLSNHYYAILADECKDESKKELVAVCLRYVNGGMVKERAVGFLDTADMSANAIANTILEVLAPFELDPLLCVGFCFDSASVMSGSHAGVQAILKNTFSKAVYVHCNAHRLNLVLCSVAKGCGHVATFLETLNSLHSFMTGSSRHARFLEIQRELHPGRQPMELERSVDTRWSSKSGSVKKVLILLDAILETLAEYSVSKCASTKLHAESLLLQMQTKKFLFLLVAFGKLFDVSDAATKGLQSSTLSVTDCTHLIESLKSNFRTFRNDIEDFNKIIKLTDDLMAKHDIANWDVGSVRARKLPARLDPSVSVVTSSLGKSVPIKNNDNLRQLWNEMLDRQITELDNRFQEDTYGFSRAAAACLPKSNTFGEMEFVNFTCAHYGLDVSEADWTVYTQHMKRKSDAGEDFPKLINVLDNTPCDIFPGIHNMIKALVTLPMTSCTVERLFSTTNRIKTCLRTSMLTSRLNNLSLLSFEREETEKMNYDEIITVFNSKPRRLRLIL